MSNDKVIYSDMKFMVEAMVKRNPLLPKQILKDLETPKNLKNFMKGLRTLVDKTAAMGSSHAFKLTPFGCKNDKGVPIYFYTVSMSSSEGRDTPPLGVEVQPPNANESQVSTTCARHTICNYKTRHIRPKR